MPTKVMGRIFIIMYYIYFSILSGSGCMCVDQRRTFGSHCILVIRLDSSCLYLLSHLVGPNYSFFFFTRSIKINFDANF